MLRCAARASLSFTSSRRLNPCLQAERRQRLARATAPGAEAAGGVGPSGHASAAAAPGGAVQLRVTAEDGRVLRGEFKADDTLGAGALSAALAKVPSCG